MRSGNVMRFAAAGFLALVAVAPQAMSENDNRDVVHDTGGHIIRNTFDNCVRTQWPVDGDPCAPQVVQEEAPAPKHIRRARLLRQEERTVYFDFNRAEITAEEQQKLDNLADVLKSDDEVKDVRIAGYADRIGSVSYNEILSKHRAKNVENYLHKREYLNTSLTKVRWLGKSDPVTQCSAKLKRKELIACLHKDRRVVVEIEYYPAKK